MTLCFVMQFRVCRIRPQIPVLKEEQPLLEIDRDERKLDVFLTFHRSSLLVSDMKIFLPFTINLDPYIKKKIKEDLQSMDEDNQMISKMGGLWNPTYGTMQEPWSHNKTPNAISHRMSRLSRTPIPAVIPPMPSLQQTWPVQSSLTWHAPTWTQPTIPIESLQKPISATTTLSVNKFSIAFYGA